MIYKIDKKALLEELSDIAKTGLKVGGLGLAGAAAHAGAFGDSAKAITDAGMHAASGLGHTAAGMIGNGLTKTGNYYGIKYPNMHQQVQANDPQPDGSKLDPINHTQPNTQDDNSDDGDDGDDDDSGTSLLTKGLSAAGALGLGYIGLKGASALGKSRIGRAAGQTLKNSWREGSKRAINVGRALGGSRLVKKRS